MSYRDLRNLCEMLRAVGYPRLVSLENFRTPNFPLVADISRWLVLQYEPKADIPSSCNTESDRVALIRAFAEFMLINVQVKLNTKRLYQADGYAVKELLKVASVLYNAVREAEQQTSSNNPPTTSSTDSATRIDIKDLKETRSLTSQLVQKGVGLYDMLSKEVNLREARSAALSKAHEHGEVERLIKSAIESSGQEGKKMTSIIDTLQNTATGIDSKIEKKRMELDRSQKRLVTLKKVRPAFMDEYEELQDELGEGYAAYVNRFRCLAHVQSQVEEKDKQEQERKLEERANKAESSRKSGDDLLSYGKGGGIISSGSDEGEEDSSEEMSLINNKAVLPSSRTGGVGVGGGQGQGDGLNLNGGGPNPDFGSRKSGPAGSRRVFGSMMGAEESEDDSEMILNNDNSELGSEDEEELQENGGGQSNGKGSKNYSNNNNNEPHTNGGTTANGGKGYPVDPGRSRSTMNRPTTGGRKAPPASDDDDF